MFLIVFVMADIILGDKSSVGIKLQIINYVILIIGTNIIISIVYFLGEKFSDKLFVWLDKRKMKKYSLYEWAGDPIWLEFHEQLSSIKEFNPKSLIDNYERIKKEIKKSFDSPKKLNAFKIYLEVKCESPRLNSLLNSTQSIFIALITFSLVTLVNFSELTQIKSLFFIFIFIIVWFGLLMVIIYMSQQIDMNKVLLKLVCECIEEETPMKKNKKR